MYSYANDNDGKYPTGKSSTEVFQQLIDGGYIYDPAVVYTRMAGKVKPLAGQKLRPENVCWDVTADVTLHSPESLPLLFTTGYKVSYAPGADALPFLKPYPIYLPEPRTLMQWWNEGARFGGNDPGIAVYYLNNSARFISFSANDAGRCDSEFRPVRFQARRQNLSPAHAGWGATAVIAHAQVEQ